MTTDKSERTRVPVRSSCGRVGLWFAVDPTTLPLVQWNGSTFLYDGRAREYREAVAVELRHAEVWTRSGPGLDQVELNHGRSAPADAATS